MVLLVVACGAVALPAVAVAAAEDGDEPVEVEARVEAVLADVGQPAAGLHHAGQQLLAQPEHALLRPPHLLACDA